MVGVGNVSQVFLARQIVKIIPRQVGRKILVTRTVDHEFGHRQPVAVMIRIDQRMQCVHPRVVGHPHQFVSHIIAD